eukprot:GHVQ01040175.1.p1 GENE.GHVQ01040175.1~~GHVQ01040175.1.p1  ORF type:complete len:115 (+),score=27.21 GHVQ01040175.1:227-571(+)
MQCVCVCVCWCVYVCVYVCVCVISSDVCTSHFHVLIVSRAVVGDVIRYDRSVCVRIAEAVWCMRRLGGRQHSQPLPTAMRASYTPHHNCHSTCDVERNDSGLIKQAQQEEDNGR